MEKRNSRSCARSSPSVLQLVPFEEKKSKVRGGFGACQMSHLLKTWVDEGIVPAIKMGAAVFFF